MKYHFEKCKKCKKPLYYITSIVNYLDDRVNILLYCPICEKKYSQLITRTVIYAINEIE